MGSSLSVHYVRKSRKNKHDVFTIRYRDERVEKLYRAVKTKGFDEFIFETIDDPNSDRWKQHAPTREDGDRREEKQPLEIEGSINRKIGFDTEGDFIEGYDQCYFILEMATIMDLMSWNYESEAFGTNVPKICLKCGLSSDPKDKFGVVRDLIETFCKRLFFKLMLPGEKLFLTSDRYEHVTESRKGVRRPLFCMDKKNVMDMFTMMETEGYEKCNFVQVINYIKKRH